MRDGLGWFHGPALVDTGSAFTVFSRSDLRFHRFAVSDAVEYPGGIRGVGGRVKAFYMPAASVTLMDAENALHTVNIQRLFMTDAPLPPIFGRELLKSFNAALHIDFNAERGWIGVG